MKSESRDEGPSISSQVLNEIRPVYQSNISGYEKDAIQEMQLASLGTFSFFSHFIMIF